MKILLWKRKKEEAKDIMKMRRIIEEGRKGQEEEGIWIEEQRTEGEMIKERTEESVFQEEEGMMMMMIEIN